MWGLVRSAQSENPGRFLLLDLDGELTYACAGEAVLRAVDADEPQVGAPGRAGPGAPTGPGHGAGVGAPGPVGSPAWRLVTVGTGTAGQYRRPVACPEVLEPLGPGQVRVAVRAAGINFRDALIAWGCTRGRTLVWASEAPAWCWTIGPGRGLGDRRATG